MRALLALLFVSVQAAQPAPGGAVIDHLLLGIGDLDRGIAEFEAKTGVRPVVGGVRPGRGTRNALVSLGDGAYIEIIAPDPEQAVRSSMVDELMPLASLTPVAWAAGTTDIFALQARLQGREIRHGAAMPGSRVLPDGSRLQWNVFSTVQLKVPVRRSDRSRMTIVLQCPKGRVNFG